MTTRAPAKPKEETSNNEKAAAPAPTLAQLQTAFEKAQAAWLVVWTPSAAKAWWAFITNGGKRGTAEAAEIYTPAMVVLYTAYAAARTAFKAAGGTPSIARSKATTAK